MRILLIRSGLLGDTIGAYSVVPMLKKHFGDNIEIDWIVRAGMESLFELDPCVKNVYPLKFRKFVLSNVDQLALCRKLASQEPYDLVINLNLGNRANYIMRRIPAKQKLGVPFQKVELPPLIHLFSSHQAICRKLLKLPNDGDNLLPELFGVSSFEIKRHGYLSKPYLILAPATSRTSKSQSYQGHRNWPLSSWKQLLEEVQKLPYQIVIVGSARDKKYIEQELEIPEHVLNCMGQTTIPELITLVREAKGVVTCDTGILHLASAVQTPIFSLLGPSDPLRHGPFPVTDPMHTVIRSNIACSPCQHTPAHKHCKINLCMQLITPQHVITAIEKKFLTHGIEDHAKSTA